MSAMAVLIRTLLRTSAIFIGTTVVFLHPPLDWAPAGSVTAQKSPAALAIDALVVALRDSDTHQRLRVLHPVIPGVDPKTFTLHAKVMVIDDRLVRVGSSNLSNRSQRVDSECDVAIEARGPGPVADTIASFDST